MTAQIVKKIISLLAEHKRVTTCCEQHEYHDCLKVHVKKIAVLVAKQEKIQFVLPAFPAKSPNPTKTFNELPDMGERLALQALHKLCQAISEFYSPGAEMIICSDGRVFNDLVKVNDANVDAYANALLKMMTEDDLTSLSLFSLDDYYENKSYEFMRHQLTTEFAETEDALKQNIKIDQTALQQFNGIHRFIYEDYLLHFCGLSKNKIRRHAKDIAYQVIRRSNAWSMLVEKIFPNAIRLSIHPQLCGSNKIGMMLLKSEDVWATPWHRVVLYNGFDYVLARKQEAEKLGAIPIFSNHQFSHYTFK